MSAALVFLEGNGIPIPGATDQLYAAMIAIAERRIGKNEMAVLLRRLSGRG